MKGSWCWLMILLGLNVKMGTPFFHSSTSTNERFTFMCPLPSHGDLQPWGYAVKRRFMKNTMNTVEGSYGYFAFIILSHCLLRILHLLNCIFLAQTSFYYPSYNYATQ